MKEIPKLKRKSSTKIIFLGKLREELSKSDNFVTCMELLM